LSWLVCFELLSVNLSVAGKIWSVMRTVGLIKN
jgi:hypothetical protein